MTKIWLVRRVVASHPNTPPTVLSVLARDKFREVQIGVAENENTTVEDLCFLACSMNEEMKNRLSENPSTPKEILFLLSKISDDSWQDLLYQIEPHIFMAEQPDEDTYLATLIVLTAAASSPKCQFLTHEHMRTLLDEFRGSHSLDRLEARVSDLGVPFAHTKHQN